MLKKNHSLLDSNLLSNSWSSSCSFSASQPTTGTTAIKAHQEEFTLQTVEGLGKVIFLTGEKTGGVQNGGSNLLSRLGPLPMVLSYVPVLVKQLDFLRFRQTQFETNHKQGSWDTCTVYRC